ncbi:MAG TPA: type II CAAX endopeptidase family protein [Terriglobia bacterium]|nr:type II CAAX endopeptidase family protein [Terriglobia bacterium]
MVKRGGLVVGCLLALAALAEGIVLCQMRVDPWRLAALLTCFSLVLGAFVGLTSSAFIKELRHRAAQSAWMAFLMPFALLLPYLVYVLGTRTFSLIGLGKLTAYIAVPILLLLPDRLHPKQRMGWRDLVAMLALALPVSAGWLSGIWTWPQELYLFRPFTCVCVGAYAFIVLRNLEGVGYRLVWRRADIAEGVINFVAFAILAIPLGIWLGFLHPHANDFSVGQLGLRFVGIYLTIAIPEEMLFRGLLQNLLVKTITRGPRGLYGLLIASVIFGAAHLDHPPVPNWKYAILATLAGVFYGNAYRTRQRLSAPALTHALVDTAWHFWF